MEQKIGEVIETNSEEKIYIILNKKVGYSSIKNEYNSIFKTIETSDLGNNLSIIENLENEFSGLLILTNDEFFKDKVYTENFNIKKECILTLNIELTQIHKKKLEKGIILNGQKLSSCSIKQLGDNYLIKIKENTENQVKKMFEELGYKIISLHRTKMGKLNIQKSGLRPGKYKKIPRELLEKKIFNK